MTFTSNPYILCILFKNGTGKPLSAQLLGTATKVGRLVSEKEASKQETNILTGMVLNDKTTKGVEKEETKKKINKS